jgi:hypothetical protein
MAAFAGWENFYVIVGSSAGALIGLQFVVITLISDIPVERDAEKAGHAFATLTIVHFGTVLLLSALLSAPWHEVAPAAVAWGVLGLAGIVYSAIVARRMRIQAAYKPESEDWLFHCVVPLTAYATLAVPATRAQTEGALFAVAAGSLLLLFVGIHNAWDAVTYHVFAQRTKQHEPGPRR